MKTVIYRVIISKTSTKTRAVKVVHIADFYIADFDSFNQAERNMYEKLEEFGLMYSGRIETVVATREQLEYGNN